MIAVPFTQPGTYLVDVGEDGVRVYRNLEDAVPIGRTDEITSEMLAPSGMWAEVPQ